MSGSRLGPPTSRFRRVCVEGGLQDLICKHSWASEVWHRLCLCLCSQVLLCASVSLPVRSYGLLTYLPHGRRSFCISGLGMEWALPDIQAEHLLGTEMSTKKIPAGGLSRGGAGWEVREEVQDPRADKACSLHTQQSIWNQSHCGANHPPLPPPLWPPPFKQKQPLPRDCPDWRGAPKNAPPPTTLTSCHRPSDRGKPRPARAPRTLPTGEPGALQAVVPRWS